MSGQKSAVNGDGHGSKHCWLRVLTPHVGGAPAGERRTYFVCRRCGAKFTHFYALAPDIFEAMRAAGVRDACPLAAGDAAPRAPAEAPDTPKTNPQKTG